METNLEPARIMVVEDEGIIAQDIKNCLENLGYSVPDVVFTGHDAIEKAGKYRPDLVLMDIVLKGEIDGIETAAEIRKHYNIPIVYLTAYEDDKTLKRAKMTEPLGYILKPFEERYLRSSIEMALYKHKMENRLKENERWLGTILKSVGDAVVVTDENGIIKFMNPVAESITGWSYKESIGKRLSEIFVLLSEDTKENIESPAERVIRDKRVLGRINHTILISRNGNEIYIDHSAAPLKDEKGNVTGVVLIITDISDRRIAENALKESETKYRNLFDHATDAIFVQSIYGDILSVNDEACRLLGYNKEQLYSLKYNDIVPPNLHLMISDINSILKMNGGTRFETQYARADGKIVDVEVSMRIIKLLGDEVIQAFVRDITERKKSQKEISMLAQAVRSISECVSITDLNGKIIFVNEAFVKVYGYSFEELIGKSLNIIRSQKNPKEIFNEIDTATFQGGWQGELINRNREGKEFPIFLSTSVVKNDKGEVVAMIGVANDITERKQLENALRESEKDYRGLFENAHDAIIIFRPEDDIILDVNQSACNIYGYSRAEFIGLSLDTIVKDIQKTREYVEETLQKGKNLRSENVHQKKDGSEMFLEVNAAIVDYKGQRAIVSINRDITLRKKAERALLESEKRYQDLYDSAPDIYFSISREGIIKSVNDYGARYLGYKKEELIGKDILSVVFNEDTKIVSETLNKIFIDRDERTELEFRKQKKNGTIIWVRERTRLIFDEHGEPDELFIICRDVTERKITEEIIREREELYRAMFEKNQAVKLLVDPDTGSVFDANIAACEYYGYDIKEIKEKNFSDIFTKSKENLFEDLKRAKKEEASYFIFQNKLSSGELRDVEIYTGPIDVRGKIHLFCIIHDITERKRVQEALLESEKKYKNLAQSAPIAVTRIIYENQSYEYVNEEFVRQSGYTMEEFNKLSDKELIDMIHEDDREKVFSFYKEWSNNGNKGTQHIDYRIINRNKEVVWLDTYLYADFDARGNLQAINQICIDVTEQNRTQIALRESEKRFRALIENSADMIALLDKTGLIMYSSPSANRILGYDPGEYINKNVMDLIHPEDRKLTIRTLRDIVEYPGKIVNLQLRVKHKNNDWLWIEATTSNLLEEPTIEALVVNYRDISERKKAEEELILQKSYFQQLFENSPEGIVIIDNEDNVVDVNKGFEKMFQYTLQEIKSQNINTILVPENLSEQGEQMSLFVLKGEVIHKETIRKRKDGSAVDVSILAYPITLGKDQIGVYGIYSDISERKEAEKALRNSQERYRAFVQQSTEGIWRFEFLEPIPTKIPYDEQVKHAFKYGYLAECNDTVAKMYGYNTAEEIVGIRLKELMVDTDPKNVEFFRKFAESGYRLNNTESQEIDKNGNLKYFINNFVGIIENDSVIRAWGTQRDITETKKANEELQRIQFRLATLLSNLPDVVLYETGGNNEFISENVIELLGYPANKFTSNRNFFNSIVHPGDLKILEAKTKAWIDAGRPGILNAEFRCRRADGTYIWLEDHMIFVKSEKENEADSMAGVLINVTEHKSAEEKLKQLAEKLSISNKELEQFAYVASHDLQEPLRMVASYIQLLQKRYKSKLDADADEFIGYAVDGVVRMKTLINDLLIYSRVNTQELPLEPVDCNKVIETVKHNLKTSITESKAKIISETLPTVYGNTLQLTQLFQNLISNAIKFKRDISPVVEISSRKTSDEWLFSVSDNGIGIEAEYADKIFVIFQRLHNYNEYPGTGIGLAICKKIVEKLGGHIWLESEIGKGSTFNFTIPIPETID
ncbi:MAG: PAS domain S-box protein [Ignavibacteriae bacterium]|nr:MAG: PAS domain S-box protein [Ignavibacteriota bacterium]